MTATLERPTTAAATRTAPVATFAVVAVHLALWGLTVARGWFYWDDFILQGQAARLGLGTDLLLNNHDGHVMPATYAVVWFLQDLSGLDYPLVAASMLLGQVLLIVAAVVGFRAVLGPGLPPVVALAVFLLNPLMLPGFTWWAAALTLTPFLTCMLFATATQAHYLRTGSRAALITTYALGVVALAFFEKSLLIPLWLFLVTVLVSDRERVRTAIRRALVDHWRLWVVWAVLVLGYLVAFAQVAEGRTRLPTGPGQVAELVWRALFKTIGPSLIGGPVRWSPVDYSASYADPSLPLMIVGGVVLLAAVVFGVSRPGAARTAWVAAAVYLAADLATFAVGRLGPAGDPGVIQAGRYVASSMVAIAIALGATAARMEPALERPRVRWSAIAGVAAVAFLALISALAYAAIWADNPAKSWVGTARADLARALPGVPLLDQDVPDFLLLPVTHPYNQASWFLAPVRPQPGFASSTDRLQILDNRGQLVAARVDGPRGLPAAACQAVPTGGSATIVLEHPVIPWLHTVAVDYDASRAGLVDVAIGAGRPVTAAVEAGRHQVYVRAEGGEDFVTIRSTGAALCVRAVQVGAVVPADLPYGGGTDITDQLEQLQ